MIIDKLENLKMYTALNPRIALVCKFVETHSLIDLPVGRHLIDGENVYVNIDLVKGKQREDAVLEYHHKMMDIAIPLTSEEEYGYTPVAELPSVDFDVQKDFAKVEGVSCQTFLTCKLGNMVICLPQDGHAPGICESAELKKAIFKVAMY
ncbi:YhcH/YjgK/YiaL family protein [Prevotella sp. S7 MS 2]|uniref:YhcH/YjgK/YiaL family protein n=1 Tax=Prevotella sp. S7 MS 2 TaxID=1287488 RepID=UPI0005139EEC|nr:YhcH/YjgK/YiaL family protein [Prevotella sp. S7 MS 2]KGI61064.1 YhcH/YjgK/YiaL family protein [Prevotella sp. S7 MS 2]